MNNSSLTPRPDDDDDFEEDNSENSDWDRED